MRAGGAPLRLPLAIPASDRPLGQARPAVFLDRDGVLNEAVPDPVSGTPESPLRIADVRLLAGAAGAARRLARGGYALVCVSNQPAAAKGKISLAELIAVHGRVLALLAQEGVQIEASRLCPHHPQGVVAELAGACECRKPAPGMLLDAAATLNLDLGRSWMLGDTDTDIEAGDAAGVRTALLEYSGSAHKRAGLVLPRLRAGDLAQAAARILGEYAR